jgi:hypothetical protein
MELHDSAPAAPVSQTPVIGATSAARLARALGTRAQTEPDGTQSISFPTPGSPAGAAADDGVPDYVPFSTAPVTVSRSPLDDIRSSASSAAGGLISHGAEAAHGLIDEGASAASSAISGSAPAPAPAPPAAGAGMDVDEIADTVIEKLRRELLIERELGGGAMDLI